MSIEEARAIVGTLISWHFFHKGIVETEPEPITQTLSELITANKKVKEANAKNKGRNGKRTTYLTVDDRFIAAIYTAANYQPSKETIIEYRGRFLAVVSASQITQTPNH